MARVEAGRCAKCGEVLTGPGHRIQISVGRRSIETGIVCDRCYAAVRLRERILWLLLAAAVAVVLFSEWLRRHP